MTFHRRSVLQQSAGFVGWLLVTFAAAWVGSMASVQAQSFYLALDRPSWAPSADVFGPVWSVLYVLMAVAVWLVWRVCSLRDGRTAFGLYLSQLVLNALWSWVFFVWHQGAGALATIVVLWALIAATMAAFARVRHLAAWLLLPYLAWVSFAAALTLSVWLRNPALL